MNNQQEDFYVECGVCGDHLKNWVGSTPCCGSIAYVVKPDGSVSKDFMLFGAINEGPIQPITFKGKEDDTDTSL